MLSSGPATMHQSTQTPFPGSDEILHPNPFVTSPIKPKDTPGVGPAETLGDKRARTSDVVSNTGSPCHTEARPATELRPTIVSRADVPAVCAGFEAAGSRHHAAQGRRRRARPVGQLQPLRRPLSNKAVRLQSLLLLHLQASPQASPSSAAAWQRALRPSRGRRPLAPASLAEAPPWAVVSAAGVLAGLARAFRPCSDLCNGCNFSGERSLVND